MCARNKMVMGEAIPKFAGGDKILKQSMKATVAREVRSKYSSDPVLLRKPFAERPPVAPIRETSEAEGPSSEVLEDTKPSSPKTKSKRGTSS